MNATLFLFVACATCLLGRSAFVPGAEEGSLAGQYKDSCTYELLKAKLTDGNREHYRPFLDTTIVRVTECGKHVLVLPSRGTAMSYLIVDAVTLDTVLQKTFRFSAAGSAWDITSAQGDYAVHMGACHVGGDFQLSIR